MREKEPNYVGEVLSSQWNLAFVGIMILLMLTVNLIGFGALLVAGEILLILLAQLEPVKHYIRLKKQIENQENLKQKESEIVKNLPSQYQRDFQSVKQICDDIEEKWQASDQTDNYLFKDLIGKLGSFRNEYAKMLQAYYFTANRDVSGLNVKLQRELDNNETALKNERNPKVREVIDQNVRIIKQRLQKTGQMNDLLRLLGVRLSVVKNSLSLLHDEVNTVANPENMSSAIDNLLLTLDIDDELKATYDEVLSNQAEMPVAPQKVQTPPQRQSRKIKN